MSHGFHDHTASSSLENAPPVRAAGILAQILSEYGRIIIRDPQRVEALLRDACPDSPLEVNLLSTALQSGAAADLASSVSSAMSPPVALLIPSLVRRLEQQYGTATAAAQWAVETWAVALGSLISASPAPRQRQATRTPLVSLWMEPNGDHKPFPRCITEVVYQQSVAVALAAGADVEGRNRWGQTALMMAAVTNNTDVLSLLLEAGADAEARDIHNATPLISAARGNTAECIHLLLSVGVDVEARNEHGATALRNASTCSQPDLVRALLQAGADVNGRDLSGFTSLMAVAAFCNEDLVRLLVLEGEADLNATDYRGHTALWHARHHPGMCMQKENIEAERQIIYLLKKQGAQAAGASHSGGGSWLRSLLGG